MPVFMLDLRDGYSWDFKKGLDAVIIFAAGGRYPGHG
jgi:hypothetical protein